MFLGSVLLTTLIGLDVVGAVFDLPGFANGISSDHLVIQNHGLILLPQFPSHLVSSTASIASICLPLGPVDHLALSRRPESQLLQVLPLVRA